ncbi:MULTISPECIES: MaoC family dehydratase [Shewanella]|uniref:MaoC family dehydratase n=1 Tax=Shewanella TaxID=22 RepID=UPI000C6BA2B6|nr:MULTISPECIES: MaoC family dehydratase [Shewanella]NCQ46094.1 MaoC family dehydratase [Shewanella frigidimarina]NCO70552.1 MaoC family dehydratase [Shewanella vesiculosa]NCP36376.1 MaoC family dehydratase [Shewanella vesiculosa]NCP69657.1 MaoC family dehydratase [Shewanella vesiculosa]NCP74960.1 MaoC family dehydratase [Shewanella vesiculosa]
MPTKINRNDIANYIGYQAAATDWFQITQDQINQFADCTLDHQFIHVDEEKAKATPFGSTIAHGFLSLSMLSHFAEEFSLLIDGFYMGLNAGFDKIRFLQPVSVNSRIRAHAKILSIEEKKPGQFRLSTEVTIEIESVDTPALVAEWISVQMVN